MINTPRLLKVSAVWVSIAYVVCFVAVAIYPALRTQFMLYALHTDIVMGQNVTTLETFVSGLIWWNVLTFLGVGLFAALFNKMKS